MSKWIKAIAGLLLLLGVGYYAYTKLKPEAEPIIEAQPPITFEVTQEPLSETLQVKGKSVYTEEKEVYSPVSGKVISWSKQDGDQVKKGDLLLTLDTKSLQAELRNLQSDIRRAKLEIRQQELSEQQGLMAEELGATGEERKKAFLDKESKRLANELSKESLAIKEQELDEKQRSLASARVYAPASGVFLHNDSEAKSQMLTEGQSIGKIVNTQLVEFKTSISEQYVAKVKAGMPVQVKMLGNTEKVLSGKIKSVARFPKSSTGAADASQPSQFDVVIAMDADELLIGGLTLEGKVETRRKDEATVVATLGIMREGDSAYVMIDSGDGQAVRQDIRTGLEIDDKTEVLEGLKPGDRIVLP